jgi:hypothetical protein
LSGSWSFICGISAAGEILFSSRSTSITCSISPALSGSSSELRARDEERADDDPVPGSSATGSAGEATPSSPSPHAATASSNSATRD